MIGMSNALADHIIPLQMATENCLLWSSFFLVIDILSIRFSAFRYKELARSSGFCTLKRIASLRTVRILTMVRPRTFCSWWISRRSTFSTDRFLINWESSIVGGFKIAENLWDKTDELSSAWSRKIFCERFPKVVLMKTMRVLLIRTAKMSRFGWVSLTWDA